MRYMSRWSKKRTRLQCAAHSWNVSMSDTAFNQSQTSHLSRIIHCQKLFVLNCQEVRTKTNDYSTRFSVFLNIKIGAKFKNLYNLIFSVFRAKQISLSP